MVNIVNATERNAAISTQAILLVVLTLHVLFGERTFGTSFASLSDSAIAFPIFCMLSVIAQFARFYFIGMGLLPFVRGFDGLLTLALILHFALFFCSFSIGIKPFTRSLPIAFFRSDQWVASLCGISTFIAAILVRFKFRWCARWIKGFSADFADVIGSALGVCHSDVPLASFHDVVGKRWNFRRFGSEPSRQLPIISQKEPA